MSENILFFILAIALSLLTQAPFVQGQRIRDKSSSSSSSKDYNDLLDDGNMLPYFPKKVKNVTVTIGQNAELKCEVDNLNNYKVAWVRVDTQTILTIHNNVITRNPRISLSRPSSKEWFLHIQRTQENDRGWYMCQINTDPMIHRSGYLEVVVPPKILSKHAEETDFVVREGENMTLNCNAVGHPKPQVIWRRDDGEQIMVHGKKAAVVESRRLNLPKISRLHMGDYMCVASNGIAPLATKKYRIRVQFPPMFWIPSQLEGAYPGQDVTIECHSEAYPQSINYWVREDGTTLISSDKYETLIVDSGYKVYMKLRIRNVNKNDFMEYKCVAKNSLGGSDGSISLYEVAAPTTTTTTTTTTRPPTNPSTTATSSGRSYRRKKEHHRKNRRKNHNRNSNETNDNISSSSHKKQTEGSLFGKEVGGSKRNSPNGAFGIESRPILLIIQFVPLFFHRFLISSLL